jgi:signal transduction histidine kinase
LYWSEGSSKSGFPQLLLLLLVLLFRQNYIWDHFILFIYNILILYFIFFIEIIYLLYDRFGSHYMSHTFLFLFYFSFIYVTYSLYFVKISNLLSLTFNNFSLFVYRKIICGILVKEINEAHKHSLMIPI